MLMQIGRNQKLKHGLFDLKGTFAQILLFIKIKKDLDFINEPVLVMLCIKR